MQNPLLKYVTLSWAVVGISFQEDACHSLSSMQKKGESAEATIERYVTGYMAFWNIAFIDKNRMQTCQDVEIIEKAKRKIAQYVALHPPVATFPPHFYLIFLNQLQIACDADGLSDVFCL